MIPLPLSIKYSTPKFLPALLLFVLSRLPPCCPNMLSFLNSLLRRQTNHRLPLEHPTVRLLVALAILADRHVRKWRVYILIPLCWLARHSRHGSSAVGPRALEIDARQIVAKPEHDLLVLDRLVAHISGARVPDIWVAQCLLRRREACANPAWNWRHLRHIEVGAG